MPALIDNDLANILKDMDEDDLDILDKHLSYHQLRVFKNVDSRTEAKMKERATRVVATIRTLASRIENRRP